jgi:hypothetical protein
MRGLSSLEFASTTRKLRTDNSPVRNKCSRIEGDDEQELRFLLQNPAGVFFFSSFSGY